MREVAAVASASFRPSQGVWFGAWVTGIHFKDIGFCAPVRAVRARPNWGDSQRRDVMSMLFAPEAWSHQCQ
eukprot:8973118-Alexandrium_andersonii.AAC.1